MTLTFQQFLTLAETAGFVVKYHGALPYGGWSKAEDAQNLLHSIEMEWSEQLDGHPVDHSGYPEPGVPGGTTEYRAYSDRFDRMVAETLEEALETCVVVAVSERTGHIHGAWSVTGWGLGSASPTNDLDAVCEWLRDSS